MLAAYLDSLSTFATVALTFLLMMALLRLARWLLEWATDQGPQCTSRKFGPRMYCFYRTDDGRPLAFCKYCGLPPAPTTPEQQALIDAEWEHAYEMDAAKGPRVVAPPTDAQAPPVLPAVAGGEHSGARLGDENGYLGTGLR